MSLSSTCVCEVQYDRQCVHVHGETILRVLPGHSLIIVLFDAQRGNFHIVRHYFLTTMNFPPHLFSKVTRCKLSDKNKTKTRHFTWLYGPSFSWLLFMVYQYTLLKSTFCDESRRYPSLQTGNFSIISSTKNTTVFKKMRQ